MTKEIDTIETYAFIMGAKAVEIETLYRMQQHALSAGYLEKEERGLAKEIALSCANIFNTTEKMIGVIKKRVDIDVKKIHRQLKRKLDREAGKEKDESSEGEE